jgi:ABC-type transport system substrate-binding protein
MSSAKFSVRYAAPNETTRGVITYSDGSLPTTLNLFALPGLGFAMFDDLFRYAPNGKTYAMMGAQLPTTNNGGIRDGGRTIIIHLKRGLRWSNNSEITSADVKFGWEVDMDPSATDAGRRRCCAAAGPDRRSWRLLSGPAKGAAPVQLANPAGIITDQQGNLFVVDSRKRRVFKFSPRGILLAETPDSIGDSISTPNGIAADTRGDLYLSVNGQSGSSVIKLAAIAPAHQ